MANLVGKLIIDEWYKMLTLAGFAVLVLSLTIELQVDNAMVSLFSLAALLIGIAELANHRYITALGPNPYGPGGMVVKGRPRRMTPIGGAFWVAGVIALGFAVYRAFQ